MNATQGHYSTKAAELRQAFDRSFAEIRHTETIRSDDLLAVRIGTDPYAIRLSEIAGLFSGKTLTRLPSRVPALIGIAGFRGTILPVYDLAMILGGPMAGTSPWLVTAANEPVAFGFDGFDGHLRVPRSSIAPHQRGAGMSEHYVREVARVSDHPRPIVHIASVLDAIKQQVAQGAARKE